MNMGQVISMSQVADEPSHGDDDEGGSNRAVSLDCVVMSAATLAAGSMPDDKDSYMMAFAEAMNAVVNVLNDLDITYVTAVEELYDD